MSYRAFDKRTCLRELPTSTAFAAVELNGRIWFPTQAGVAGIDPKKIPENLVPPPVFIDSVLVDGKEQVIEGDFTMKPDNKRIDFIFTALSYVVPENVEFQYRLEGFDKEWSPASKKREASYTNLSPGKYRFTVRAYNNDGIVSDPPASLNLEKKPLFYQTFWFLGLCLALSIVALFLAIQAINHLRVGVLKKKLVQQEKELELERKAVESERHAKELETNLKNSYSRFVPPEFIRLLNKESILDIKLGDQVEKELCIMFSDIRAFSSISEQMTPEENFNFLNTYLKMAGPVIRGNDGFIDKYIGDAIMALFPGDAEKAIRAAIELQHCVHSFNEANYLGKNFKVTAGVGLHVGKLMLGTIGEENRMDATVISDAVNLASRLEGLNKVFGSKVIVSEDIVAKFSRKNLFSIRFIGRVRVLGKKKSIAIYEILDAETKQRKAAIEETIGTYDVAMKHYYNRQFAEAIALFEEILASTPEDCIVRRHLASARHYVAKALPDGWDGIENLELK